MGGREPGGSNGDGLRKREIEDAPYFGSDTGQGTEARLQLVCAPYVHEGQLVEVELDAACAGRARVADRTAELGRGVHVEFTGNADAEPTATAALCVRMQDLVRVQELIYATTCGRRSNS